MIEIIPNWHPMLVHFTLALFMTSAALFVVGSLTRSKILAGDLLVTARWNLWLGALITVATVFAGFYAYNTVGHDGPSHAAMTSHKNWAVPTALALIILALWLIWTHHKGRQAGLAFVAILIVATVALFVTGFKGGEAVYRYGLGVMSLPKLSGDGDHGSHEHAPGEEHGATSVAPDVKETGHSHAPGEEHQGAADTAAMAEKAGHRHAVPTTAMTVLQAFHHALQEGDKVVASDFLAVDVLIYENGNAEASRDEYANHHMIADMAFLKEMQQQILSQTAHDMGDLVWITTQSRTQGTYKGKVIDTTGTETALLQRRDGMWKIIHIHWS